MATSATSAVVGSVGIGATTALHVPGGYLRAASEIWQSEAPAPLKVGGQLLATAGAVLAVPLGIAGGAVYGLGMGAYKGYTEGFVAGKKLFTKIEEVLSCPEETHWSSRNDASWQIHDSQI